MPITNFFSRQWWKEMALPKIKNNSLDLIALGVFIGGSIFMAASIPAVTITITTLSIGISIYFDKHHTKEKRALFDKRKQQIQLGEGVIVADPSWLEQKVKKGGFWLSVGALTVYVGLSAWNSWAAASSVLLEVVYGVDIFLAISSCHIGRKIYDMKLGAGLVVMEAETDKILIASNFRNSDTAKKWLAEQDQLRARHTNLVRRMTLFFQAMNTEAKEARPGLNDVKEFLQSALQTEEIEIKGSTAQISVRLPGSTMGEPSASQSNLTPSSAVVSESVESTEGDKISLISSQHPSAS